MDKESARVRGQRLKEMRAEKAEIENGRWASRLEVRANKVEDSHGKKYNQKAKREMAKVRRRAH